MEKKVSSPTMKNVAQEAGVALSTVSKVVNGLPVGQPYKIRVEMVTTAIPLALDGGLR